MGILKPRRRKSSRRKFPTGKRRRTLKTLLAGTKSGKQKYGGTGYKPADQLVYLSKMSNPSPVAARMFTSFSVQNQGYIPAAAATQGYFQVSMNCPQLPFSTATTVSGTTLPNPVTAIATQNPIAWSSFSSINMYATYRCVASKIQIRVIPSALTDPLAIMVYPAIPGSALNYSVADSMPYGKSWLVTSEKGDRNWLTAYADVGKLTGVSPQAVRDDVSGTFTGTAAGTKPGRLYSWYVLYNDLLQSNIGAKVGLDVRVTYYVELLDLNYDNFFQT